MGQMTHIWKGARHGDAAFRRNRAAGVAHTNPGCSIVRWGGPCPFGQRTALPMTRRTLPFRPKNHLAPNAS
jgi:hypothetical protein